MYLIKLLSVQLQINAVDNLEYADTKTNKCIYLKVPEIDEI